MADVVNEELVAASPAQVWAVLGEGFGDLGTWARLGAPSHLEGEGPVGLGSTRIVEVPRAGRLRETVVGWEPERLLAYQVFGLPGFIRSIQSTWTLTPEGAGTRVRMVSTIEPGWGLVGRVLVAAMQGSNQKLLARLVRNLKRHVERGGG